MNLQLRLVYSLLLPESGRMAWLRAGAFTFRMAHSHGWPVGSAVCWELVQEAKVSAPDPLHTDLPKVVGPHLTHSIVAGIQETQGDLTSKVISITSTSSGSEGGIWTSSPSEDLTSKPHWEHVGWDVILDCFQKIQTATPPTTHTEFCPYSLCIFLMPYHFLRLAPVSTGDTAVNHYCWSLGFR